MRVLVACEFSGVVRDAFTALGHDAWSCDLLPTERPGQHLQGDVLAQLAAGWDLMVAHPPCTYLANSGVCWLYKPKAKDLPYEGPVRDETRWAAMQQAAEFFLALLAAPIPRIAVENPIPHRHASLPPYSQIFQPWHHGHGETKATCLWLRGLPLLRPSNVVEGRQPRSHWESPGPDRWKARSRTLEGVAAAFAAQWGGTTQA